MNADIPTLARSVTATDLSAVGPLCDALEEAGYQRAAQRLRRRLKRWKRWHEHVRSCLDSRNLSLYLLQYAADVQEHEDRLLAAYVARLLREEGVLP